RTKNEPSCLSLIRWCYNSGRHHHLTLSIDQALGCCDPRALLAEIHSSQIWMPFADSALPIIGRIRWSNGSYILQDCISGLCAPWRHFATSEKITVRVIAGMRRIGHDLRDAHLCAFVWIGQMTDRQLNCCPPFFGRNTMTMSVPRALLINDIHFYGL